MFNIFGSESLVIRVCMLCAVCCVCVCLHAHIIRNRSTPTPTIGRWISKNGSGKPYLSFSMYKFKLKKKKSMYVFVLYLFSSIFTTFYYTRTQNWMHSILFSLAICKRIRCILTISFYLNKLNDAFCFIPSAWLLCFCKQMARLVLYMHLVSCLYNLYILYVCWKWFICDDRRQNNTNCFRTTNFLKIPLHNKIIYNRKFTSIAKRKYFNVWNLQIVQNVIWVLNIVLMYLWAVLVDCLMHHKQYSRIKFIRIYKWNN